VSKALSHSIEQHAEAQLPLAVVRGEPITVPPKDLYIPPDALEIYLETFEGPLDLLLYLIKRQNLNILDIPIAEITHQYMEYIEMMNDLRLELAAEYLVMAAMLAEIKSRMLLPRPVEVNEEEDPRAELIRRLQEYECFKQAAEDIDELPRMERDIFPVSAAPPEGRYKPVLPDVDLLELLMVFKEVLQRAEMFNHHHIRREALSVRERMTSILSGLSAERFASFTDLFDPMEGRKGVLITFLAVLELVKEQLVELVQSVPFAPVYVKASASIASE
jgi:segregation and condensation protein A